MNDDLRQLAAWAAAWAAARDAEWAAAREAARDAQAARLELMCESLIAGDCWWEVDDE